MIRKNELFTKHQTIIQPKKGWQMVDFKELKNYKDLFWFFIIRDIKVRYKQTVLGGLWAIIQPLLAMVVFTLFFGKLAKMPSDGIPYPVFNFSAMIAWTYFVNTVTISGSSLIGSSNLITKVYFPRLVVPLTPAFAGLLDFFIAFTILIGMMLFFHIYPTVMVIFLPLLIVIMMLTAVGVGTFFAALNVKYRDIRYVIPFLIQLGLFISPVVYPASMVPGKYQFIYSLNPMAGVIEGFRSILFGTTSFPVQMVVVSAFVSVILFLSGIVYFKQMERYFADII